LNEVEVRKILEESRALMSGHFKLSSGRHSEYYMQCAKVLQFPDRAEQLGKALADLARMGERIDAVASPAVGGVVIGQEVARALGVRALFAERDAAGKFVFRRGFVVIRNERFLLVDDVLTTGLSLWEMADLVKAEGGRVVGLAALAERGYHEKNFTMPRHTLLKLDFEDYDPAACPLCEKRIPLEKPGTRPNK
jgi:orotate phosphoribosyltransferase